MIRSLRIISIAALCLLVTASIRADRSSLFTEVGQSSRVAVPRILQPYLDKYDLTGKDVLEFKWSPHEGNQTERDYYDFRLYKSYTVLASTLIYKTRVPPRQWSLSLSADMFEDGQVYTLALRQVYTGSIKSWRAFQSFKIIKKAAKEVRDAAI